MGQSKANSTKEKSTKPLPTWRVPFQRQLEILRGYAAASGPSPRAVSNTEVADVIKTRPEKVSLTNIFFASIGLLERGDAGYIPSAEVLVYARACEWNADTAFYKTAPLFEKAWFSEVLLPKLRFGPLSKDDAVAALAEVTAASPELRPQLELILEYMQAAGICTRDESGKIRLAKTNGGDQPGEAQEAKPAPGPNREPEDVGSTETGSRHQSAVGSAGAIQLNININVNMDKMSKWKPELITAFLGGLAQVLAAKGEAEKNEGQPQ